MRNRPSILTPLLLLLIMGLPAGIIFAAAQEAPNSYRGQEAAPSVYIGDIQGSVGENMSDPQTFKSPMQDQRVRISGVVTNRIMITTDSRVVNAFFLQELPSESDGDPLTSDGILAIIGASSSLDGHPLAVGDLITLEGEVDEFYDNTRLIDLALVSVDGRIEDLDSVMPPIEINPTGSFEEVSRMYERLEGMRVYVPTDTLVVAPTHIFTSTNDTETYVIRDDHPVASRETVYARRVFRDPHVLDDGLPGENPYRISVEANILKANAGDYEVNLPPYQTYDVFKTPLTGNLVYAYGRYTLHIEALPEVETTVPPDENLPPTAIERDQAFSVAIYNVQNLYDFYNDPFDFRDTPGDTRLNYVPYSLEDYQTHINKIALSIVDELHAPDIIAFQEIEDQDVCHEGGQLYGTCSESTDNLDGQPDVLQDVAAAVAIISDGDIIYVAATDRDSADDRGIAQGYLYRTDRVELVPATPEHPLLGARPDDPASAIYAFNQEVSNPKALNQRFGPGTPTFSRAPVVALFRIHREAVGSQDYVEVYVSNNHFKSDPTAFIQLRRAQSLYNLDLVDSVLATQPEAHFLVLGDLNSFPESEELSVLEPTLESLWDEIPAVSRYTYIYAGQTQTLDYIYATPSLMQSLLSVEVAHINADYPFQYGTDATTPYRAADHDPVIANFAFPQN
ncbi:MAG: hypothetical protein GYB66_00930 [Chloroflexi bacterium]|nr:hypothetical protein [Chloroflexota bacterium]